jgi:hypothetical protein
MSHVKKFFFLLAGLVLVVEGFGQSAASPYSTFGLGERYGNALVNNQGMAGIGVSQPQYWYANNINPALLIYNTLTIFNAGVMYEQRNIKSASMSEKTKGGNLNYLVTAFPVKAGKWSMSFALSPYTTLKYNLASTQTLQIAPDSIQTFETYQNGSGGISQFSWSHGVRIYKSLALGLRANYLFGTNYNLYQNRSLDSQQPINYYATIEEQAYVKDFTFQMGISYAKDSLFARKKYRLAFGAVYDFATNLRAKTNTIIYRTNAIGNHGRQIDVDTIPRMDSTRSGYSLPAGFTVGVTLGRSKWAIGSEFSYYDWSTFRSVNSDDEVGLGKSWKVALGGEITPDSYSSNYLKRLTYRIGGFYEQTPYQVQNTTTPVKDLGMTLGLSLPAGSSSLDIGFRYGKRGNVQNNRIGENYIRLFFGVTVNDRWFIRRRFD